MPIFTKVADPAGGKWVEVGANEGGGGGGSSWGDFTTNGDEDDSGTYKDGVGREWKWAEWNDPTKTPTVTMTGGLYHVLCVGGGARSYDSTPPYNTGQPGQVSEGLWEFGPGTPTVTVGRKGIPGASVTASEYGQPSFIGERVTGFGNQGISRWGPAHGAGGMTLNDAGQEVGYKSRITGDEVEYATGRAGVSSRGQAGSHATSPAEDGCVIIATVTNDPSDWNPPGQLPGVGGWATVQSITGSAGTRYTYNDGVMDWVAYEFTDDGTLTKSEGLADVLLISGGSGYHSQWANGGDLDVQPGGGGDAVSGIHNVGLGALTVTVGSGGPANNYPWGTPGAASVLGSLETRCGRLYGMNSNGLNDPITSSITGVSETYAEGGFSKPSSSGRGDGAKSSGQSGTSGIVVIRVPAANAKASLPDTGWVDA